MELKNNILILSPKAVSNIYKSDSKDRVFIHTLIHTHKAYDRIVGEVDKMSFHDKSRLGLVTKLLRHCIA